MARTEPVRIGLVGAGFLAATRARCYRQVSGVGATLHAVASRRAETARRFASEHGVATVHDDAEALFGDPDVEVVDLCVPNLLHRPLAEAAAQAGKHVICTKPLTAYVGQDLGEDPDPASVAAVDRRRMLEVAVADAEAIVAATERAGVRLCYGENWIYAPAIERAAALVAAGGGHLLEMRGWECHSGSHSEYSKTWRNTGGGALLRLAAHPIGAMLFLKRAEGLARDGAPIVPIAVSAETTDLSRVFADAGSSSPLATGWVDVENWGCAVLSFSDGSRGVAYGSDNVLGGMQSRLELYGSRAHFVCQLSPNDLLRAYAADGAPFAEQYLMEKLETKAGWSTPMPDEDWTSGQGPMIQAFVDDLAADRPSASDGQLGLDVTRVIYAAYVAAAEGRRVELG